MSIISRVDKKRERPTAAAAAQGVGRAGGQSYMFGIYGNLPTSAILDIFHSERGQRRDKTKFPLVFFVFLPPILLFFIFFGLILFSFVSLSSRRPSRLNRSRRRRRRNTEGRTPGFPLLLRWKRRTFSSSSQDRTANIYYYTHAHTHTYIRTRLCALFLFLFFERKERRCGGIKGGPLIKDRNTVGVYREDYKKKRRGQECHSPWNGIQTERKR